MDVLLVILMLFVTTCFKLLAFSKKDNLLKEGEDLLW